MSLLLVMNDFIWDPLNRNFLFISFYSEDLSVSIGVFEFNASEAQILLQEFSPAKVSYLENGQRKRKGKEAICS